MRSWSMWVLYLPNRREPCACVLLIKQPPIGCHTGCRYDSAYAFTTHRRVFPLPSEGLRPCDACTWPTFAWLRRSSLKANGSDSSPCGDHPGQLASFPMLGNIPTFKTRYDGFHQRILLQVHIHTKRKVRHEAGTSTQKLRCMTREAPVATLI